jgi:hypothetical protein
MMPVMFVEGCDRRQIPRLGVCEFVAENYDERLTASYILSQFRSDATNNTADQRDDWSFLISVRLDHAGRHLSSGFRSRALADCFILKPSRP